jgi:outer membrane lipoprotein-sorting protein
MRRSRKSPTDPPAPFSRAAAPLALVAALALFALGCVGGRRGPDPAELSDSGPALELARALWERGREIPTFAARGSLNLTEGNTTRFVRFELLTVRPDKLVLTLLDPLGRPALKAVSDGLKLVALDYGGRLAAVGAATETNIRRVLPVGLSPETLLAILSDALILRPDRAAAGYSADGAVVSLLLSTFDQTGETVWSVSLQEGPEGPLVSGLSVKAQGGRPALSVTYGTFKSLPVEGLDPPRPPRSFPHLVEAQTGDGRRLTVRYDEVRLGATLPAEVFLTEIPEGFAVESI